jgi:hypothetical protein
MSGAVPPLLQDTMAWCSFRNQDRKNFTFVSQIGDKSILVENELYKNSEYFHLI